MIINPQENGIKKNPKENFGSYHFKILVFLKRCQNVNFICYKCFRQADLWIQYICFWKILLGQNGHSL